MMPGRRSLVRVGTPLALALVATLALVVALAAWWGRGDDPGQTLTEEAPRTATAPPRTAQATATADPRPSFPDATSTGVPGGVELEPSEGMTVDEDGLVVEGLHVRGRLVVEADGVTIRNTLVQSGAHYPIHVTSDATGTVIEDVEVDNLGRDGIGIFVQGDDTIVRGVDVHSAEDGIRIQADAVMVEASFVHDLERRDGGHHDTIQIRSGDDVVIRGNNLQPYNATTDFPMNSAIQIGSLVGDDQISNLLVTGNLMNGGNYTINGGGRDEVDSARYAENWFGRDFRYGVHANLQNSVWEDSNRWLDTADPAP